MSTGTVFILRGIPGAGKSRLTKKLLKNRKDSVVVSADDYFMGADGKYRFIPSELGNAHHCCLFSFIEWVERRKRTVIVDNTNTTVAEVAPYAALALAHDYKVQIITIKANAREAARRNVHGVPVETVLRMAKRLKEETPRLPAWWPHKFIDSSGRT
jgi:predicted kinase